MRRPDDSPAAVDTAVTALDEGGFVVLVDDLSGPPVGHLLAAADAVTAEHVAFMVRRTTGIICVAMPATRADELGLPPMVDRARASPLAESFSVSVDLVTIRGSGSSAADRAATVDALADPDRSAPDFARPGHVFPLRATDGGVLAVPGVAEAAVDLCWLGGRAGVAALSEIVEPDGSLADLAGLAVFAHDHGVPSVLLSEVVQHRYRTESVVSRFSTARLPTRHGEFTALVYRSSADGTEHLALVAGDLGALRSAGGRIPPLVRVHSECLTGDVLGSLRCDCGLQLEAALGLVAAEGTGVVVYLRGHEGRGIGLGPKMAAYALQDRGHDTVDANTALGLPVDARSYGIAGQILTDLGVRRLRLITNNPAKAVDLAAYDLEVVERVPATTPPNAENLRYLSTKARRLGHLLDLDDTAVGEP